MKNLVPLLPTLIIFPIGVLFFESPVTKLVWATLGLLFLQKVSCLVRNIQSSLPIPRAWGWPAYLFLWPGMRPETFTKRSLKDKPLGHVFVTGFLFFILGFGSQIILFLYWGYLPTFIRPYLGLFSFLILIHFGFSSILFVVFRISGWKVEPLFMSPFLSTSLRDFWSCRWNLAFVDMDKRLFLPLFSKKLPKMVGFIGIFLLSGILHEIGISYPVNAGWGGPLLYFIIHGGLTCIESKISILKLPLYGRIWLWTSILVPLPLLFHQPFIDTFIEPYFMFGYSFVNSLEFTKVLEWAIFIAGFGHFIILIASFQVPKKLNWKEELSKLVSFNRKIFWTYGGYIVFCIISFALVDIFNATAFLEPHSSSLAIALFIAVFWTIRVIVDFFYYKHTDWPPGDEFIIGHTCLTALFCILALIHWSLVLWQITLM